MMKPVTFSLVETPDLPQEKTSSLERLKTLGIPGNKTEQYRHFAIKPLLSKEYNLLQGRQEIPEKGERLIIENGTVTTVPEGITVSFETAADTDDGHFDALYYLSHLLAPQTIMITADTDAAFELHHLVSSSRALIPYRIVLKTAENTRIQVYETFETAQSEESLILYGIDARVSDHSTLRWIRNETSRSDCASLVGSNRFDIARQGALELKTFDFGSGNALHLYKIDLDEYAWTDAVHLLLASEKARRGNVVHINHNKRYAKSVQEARSILKGEATGIFDGRIKVAHDAKYASAHQNSKAILLDEHAYMYAKPQLEIYTDELEASHGSTTGQLDEEALFYLASRGISHDDARKILVLAFADTLIETIGDNKIIEAIHTDFEAAYYKHSKD